MNKIKFLTIIVALLLASNLSLVAYLFFRKNSKPEGPRKEVIERLHFDENQIKTYDKLIDVHRITIRQTEDSIRLCKSELYNTLQNGAKANQKDSLMNELCKWQIRIENVNYQHFIDIKSICNASQQKDFDLFTADIVKLFPRIGLKQKQ